MGVQFTVNGRSCEVAQDDHGSLVEHLREGLGLKGTRYGCGQERCGAHPRILAAVQSAWQATRGSR